MKNVKLTEIIDKLYYISHTPPGSYDCFVSITLTQRELDFIILILTEYRRITEGK